MYQVPNLGGTKFPLTCFPSALHVRVAIQGCGVRSGRRWGRDEMLRCGLRLVALGNMVLLVPPPPPLPSPPTGLEPDVRQELSGQCCCCRWQQGCWRSWCCCCHHCCHPGQSCPQCLFCCCFLLVGCSSSSSSGGCRWWHCYQQQWHVGGRGQWPQAST